MNERAVVVQVQPHFLAKRLNNVLRMRVPDPAVHLPKLARKVGGRVVLAGPVVLRLVQQVVRVQGLFVHLDRSHADVVQDAVLA